MVSDKEIRVFVCKLIDGWSQDPPAFFDIYIETFLKHPPCQIRSALEKLLSRGYDFEKARVIFEKYIAFEEYQGGDKDIMTGLELEKILQMEGYFVDTYFPDLSPMGMKSSRRLFNERRTGVFTFDTSASSNLTYDEIRANNQYPEIRSLPVS